MVTKRKPKPKPKTTNIEVLLDGAKFVRCAVMIYRTKDPTRVILDIRQSEGGEPLFEDEDDE